MEVFGDFLMNLSDYERLIRIYNVYRGIKCSFYVIFVRKIPMYNCFTADILNCRPIFKSFAAHVRTNFALNLARG